MSYTKPSSVGTCPPTVLFRGILVSFSQGLVKGTILCFRNPYFYFRHGESTSTASQLTSPASQKSRDLNKVLLLLQDLELDQLEVCLPYSRLLTEKPILAVFQNLLWSSNKTSLIKSISASKNPF